MPQLKTKQKEKPKEKPTHLAFGSAKPLNSNIRRKRRRGGIAGIIFIGSFVGLVVLVIGALIFNELRTGLTEARSDALKAQGLTIASVLAEAAVVGEPAPELDSEKARIVLRRLFRAPNARLRLYSSDKKLIADSNDLYDEINVRELPPLGGLPDVKKTANDTLGKARVLASGTFGDAAAALDKEISEALIGNTISQERISEDGERVVSVSVPLQRVKAVVGVLTLESDDVSEIISRERWALVPFIGAALLANLVVAGALSWSIARPLRRLAAAADQVSLGKAPVLSELDLSQRADEIGELSEALSTMTESLSERIDANESFAADVAHEIKNPLAAIRNAAELLQKDLKPEQRAKLESLIMSDIDRVDRLVTDISNASRLDAELARQSRKKISLQELVKTYCETYGEMVSKHGIRINLELPTDNPLWVMARPEAISRIIINLLDNAISFAPVNSRISVIGQTGKRSIRLLFDDEGNGIPEEAIERIFERFYTQRPKIKAGIHMDGQAEFGAHSGLGLAIARQIAEGHDGKLYAENRIKDGKILGARFILELPSAHSH